MPPAATPNYVDWAVYVRDQERHEKQFEQLVERLDRLAQALEGAVTQEAKSRYLLRAEWIRLLSAFLAGSIPAVVLAFFSTH